MLYIKMLSVFVVTTIIFICCDKTPSTAGNGSETENAFSGRILYEDGSPAAGVSVRVLPVDNVPSIAAAKSMVVTTDSNGYYNVAGLDSGLYNVEGLKDTLGVFVDSIVVNAKPSIPDGVLKKVGEVTGVTHMEGQTDTNQVRVTLYMPGTSRITKSVIGGRFSFENMPEGAYQLIIDPLPQYNVKILELRVLAGQMLNLDTIFFKTVTPDTIDINQDYVYGDWGPDKTYRLFTSVAVDISNRLTIHEGTKVLFMGRFGINTYGNCFAIGKPDNWIEFRNGFNDTGSWGGIGSAFQADSLVLRYCLFVKATNINISVQSPGYVEMSNCVFRDIKNWIPLSRSVNGGDIVISNNIFINMTDGSLDLSGISQETFSSIFVVNNIFMNAGMAFKLPSLSNFQRLPIDYNCYFQTQIPAKDSIFMGVHILYADPLFEATASNNDYYRLQPQSPCRGSGLNAHDIGVFDTLRIGDIDSMKVRYLHLTDSLRARYLDVPVVFAGNDTTVFINDSVHLSGQSSSQLGNIVKWEWDIGNTGSFISLPSGIYSYKAPAAPSTQTCIFRATDNDGSVASDSLKVTYDPDSNFIKLNSFGMKLIPAGTFTDLQGKTASISYPFFIDSTEVTQNRFESITGCNPSVIVGAQKPVTNISFYLAAIYCNMLSKTCGLDTVYDYTLLSQEPFLYLDSAITNFVCRWDRSGFRLPTEDEWTLACMGGTGNFFYWGNEKDSLFSAQFAWTEQMPSTLHDVAQLSPNSYHLYDMIGNVREFCFGGNCDHPTRTDFICDREYYCMAMGGHYAALLDSTTIREEVTRYQMSNYRGFRCVRLAK